MFRNQYDQVIRTLQEHMKMLNRLFEGCTDVESTGTFASDRICLGSCETGRCRGWMQERDNHRSGDPESRASEPIQTAEEDIQNR
mmetsp:Transcript_7235/g.21899  ORF Transcript_7235/g.21899 Transcript_7235/m.21899 type:complete len:85 (+) Transcript_7235:4054-4308(+)